jgi:hypothetical protein
MKYIKWIIVIATGAIGGFGYWYFVGCNSGSCPITSSPVNSSVYGALMGALLLNAFTSGKKGPQEKKDK